MTKIVNQSLWERRLRQKLAAAGRKGGKATGACKVTGTSEEYRARAKKRWAKARDPS